MMGNARRFKGLDYRETRDPSILGSIG
jgi:hypothetical protein